MEPVFDVFVGDPLIVDLLVYDCWLKGLTENDVAKRCIEGVKFGIGPGG